MSKVLVSLVSDQTIPNVEFIREMGHEADSFLFISTKGMEARGQRQWILNTVALDANRVLPPVVVDEFSFEDIEQKLANIITDEDTYLVNLTGGTKVMSLAVYEFFKTVNSEMYYLTGKSEKIKIHPGRKKVTSKLSAKISLSDYLTAYGFSITNQSQPLRSKPDSEKMLDYFLQKFDRESDVQILNELRVMRSKGIKHYVSNHSLISFLDRTGFRPESEGKLSKYECRYLTGDWLEEYLFYVLKEHFNLSEAEIGLGLFVDKSGAPNEFDVLLMKKNKIYLFECKTSIYTDSDESQTFIGETIYKSDSLRNKLGLFAQTTVVTLSDLSNPKLTKHIERADANRVKLIGKSSFLNNSLLNDLNKI